MIGRTNSTFGGAISLPDGSTATANDVQTWLKCAGINKSYTTVNQVIADTNTMFLLMSDENAMKYLARSTNFADAICADETSMTYLGQSAYVDSTVLNSDLWVSSIISSSYIDKIFIDLIPTMSSLSNDVCTVTDNTWKLNEDVIFYKAFDKNINTNILTNEGVNGSEHTITFKDPVKIYYLDFIQSVKEAVIVPDRYPADHSTGVSIFIDDNLICSFNTLTGRNEIHNKHNVSNYVSGKNLKIVFDGYTWNGDATFIGGSKYTCVFSEIYFYGRIM